MDMASGNFSASGLMGQTTTSNITTANAIGSNASNSLPGNKETISMTLSTSLDAMFKRKRGRPPKNRVVEVCKFSYFAFIENKLTIATESSSTTRPATTVPVSSTGIYLYNCIH